MTTPLDVKTHCQTSLLDKVWFPFHQTTPPRYSTEHAPIIRPLQQSNSLDGDPVGSRLLADLLVSLWGGSPCFH